MHTIFQTLVYQREKGHDAVLATIIWDDGSAPRGKGSQMLVGRDGLLAGTIGGGAVEGQAIACVHPPVGTAIKAVTPEELAVSIAGEMILVRATRREANGEVHHGCPMH